MGPQLPDGHDYDSVNSDPLSDFFAEPAAAPPPDPESPQDNRVAAPSEAPSADSDLMARVTRAERLLERTVLEMSTLKSDLATLVSAVDDIKKRQSRRLEPPLTATGKLPARLSRAATGAAAVILMVVGFGLWGVYAVTSSYEAPAPQPVESAPAEPVRKPAPITTASAPPQIQSASAITAVLPARDSPPRASPPSPPAPAPSASRSRAAYVGTLTIDASPPGEVFLNRKSVGRTPLRLDNLRAGSHLVWIQSDGHRRWTRVVAVAADKVSRVTADLDPIDR